MAGEMAQNLGKKVDSKRLINKWLYAFLRRWKTEVTSLRSRQLETTRAKAATPEAISTYFNNLKPVIEENGLSTKPHLIYN